MTQVRQTRPALIRAWLATQDGRRELTEIAAATGIPRRLCAVALGDMRRLGHVGTEGTPGAFTYALTGKAVRPWACMTAEQRRESKRLSRIRCRRKKGVRPAAEVRAERSAIAAAKREQRQREKAERKAARASKPKVARSKPAPSRPRVVASRPAKPERRRQPVAPVLGSLTAPPKQAPVMTSDDFLAMGGQIERIPAAWEKAA